MLYQRDHDRFRLFDKNMPLSDDVACFPLGNETDFLLFDNVQLGALRVISHSAGNHFAIELLSRIVIDNKYAMACDSLREVTRAKNSSEQHAEVVIPYSNKRRLGRAALHARALTDDSPQALAFYKRVTGDDAGGEGLPPSA